MIGPLISLITILLINLELSLAQRIDEVASIKADSSQESKAPILIIQPKYMRSEVVMMIPKARHTVYSAGYLGKLGLTNFKAEEFRMKYRGGWKEFKKKALKQSAILLKSIQPEYIKNTQGDIEYAILQSSDPLLASSVHTGEFRKIFKSPFGPNLWVIIPNRSTILVMKADKNRLNTYKKAFYHMFLDATYPVSREVFLVNPDGFSAIGDLNQSSN